MLVIGAALLALGGYFLAEDAPHQAQVADAAATADPGVGATERTAALPPLNLPADDAAHGSRMEWWYYNGSSVPSAGVVNSLTWGGNLVRCFHR